MSRQRLPDRRPSVTTTFVHDCQSYAVTFGFDPNTGRIGEVFAAPRSAVRSGACRSPGSR